MRFIESAEPHYEIRRITKNVFPSSEKFLQEKEMFEGRKVSDRIVSIDRHYVRPIVRGKETKPVEFGAKEELQRMNT